MNYLSLPRWMGNVGAVLLICGLVSCNGAGSKVSAEDTAAAHLKQITDSLAASVLADTTLPDGTKIFYKASTKFAPAAVSHAGERVYDLDGEAYLTIWGADKKPFVIRTRQLIITVLSPMARLHIEGQASSPGEQADLLEGKATVTKAYHSSTDSMPETLKSGDMVMINKDIDLMEKETLNPAERTTLETKFPKTRDSIPHN